MANVDRPNAMTIRGFGEELVQFLTTLILVALLSYGIRILKPNPADLKRQTDRNLVTHSISHLSEVV